MKTPSEAKILLAQGSHCDDDIAVVPSSKGKRLRRGLLGGFSTMIASLNPCALVRMTFVFGLALVALGPVALAPPASAQWSSNPGSNLAIADKTGDQVQPKIRPTSDGGCYITWLDNSAGGYDTYIQRLNRQGVEQWPHNGVLVADTSFSSTEDYGLAVDANDNAIVAFRDDRSGGVQIAVNKISPAGALLWGASAVQLSVNAGQGHSPRVAVCSDGHYVCGWSEGTGYRIQRCDPMGNVEWAAGGLSFAPATGSYSLSELQGSDNGSVIAFWVRPLGNIITSNKHLYTQKHDSNGIALWNSGNPVIVYDGGSVQIGYFPNFVADNAGGGIYGWYEVSGSRNAYVQRINASGAEVFPHNGVACSTNTAGRIRISSSVAYSAGTDEIFFFWSDSSSPTQNMWGVYGQKFNGATGARQWTDNGKELVPLSSLQTSFVTCVADNDGHSDAFWFDQPGSGASVMGARLNGAGVIQWGGSPIQICSVTAGKSRLSASLSACKTALVAWGDDRNAAPPTSNGTDIYAQNVKPNGTFGNVARPGDVDGNNYVNIDDLFNVIGHWGPCAGCAADVSPVDCPNGYVNIDDLFTIISDWG
jgi:hypothetical protein